MWDAEEARSRKPKNNQRGEGSLAGAKGGAEGLALGVSRKSSHMRWEGSHAIQFVPPRSVSCVLNYEMSRRLLASQRVRVTPVMVGESARSKSPLLAGKRMLLPNAHTLVLLCPVYTVRKITPLHLH